MSGSTTSIGMMLLPLVLAHIVFNLKILVQEHLQLKNFGLILRQSQRESNGTSQEEPSSMILMEPQLVRDQGHGLLLTSSTMNKMHAPLMKKLNR
jgi:hypothetical protein